MASFLEIYDAISGTDPVAVATQQAICVGQYFAQSPNELFDELRVERPIFVTPGLVFLARAQEVRELLSRPDVFTVAPNTPKMNRVTPTGFMLGTVDMTKYVSDVGLMRSVIFVQDMEHWRGYFLKQIADIIAQAQTAGSIDVVKDLSRVIPYLFVAHYLGVPGPSADELKLWIRRIFHDVFLNLSNDAVIRNRAVAAAEALRLYLDEHIRDRKQQQLLNGKPVNESVLDRLLLLPGGWSDNEYEPPTHDRIRDNLIGFMVGAIETTSKALVFALQELLVRRPKEWKLACAVVQDDQKLLEYIFEALRFNPQSIAVLRKCESDYKFGEILVKKDSLVIGGTRSALFDSTLVEEPMVFRVGRPIPHDFLRFGYGVHSCFGRHFAQLMLVEMMRGLCTLLGPDYPDANPKVGEIHIDMDGPFPDSWLLECGPPKEEIPNP